MVSSMPPKKRAPGRPPTVGSEPRDEIIRIRMTSDDRAKLQAQADAAGIPLAEFLYRKLLGKRAR